MSHKHLTDTELDRIRFDAMHCARVQCVAVHDFEPASTPCEDCVGAATRVLAAKFLLDRGEIMETGAKMRANVDKAFAKVRK